MLNLTNDVLYERRYENMGYYISRSGADRKDINLEEVWQYMNDARTLEALKTGFMWVTS